MTPRTVPTMSDSQQPPAGPGTPHDTTRDGTTPDPAPTTPDTATSKPDQGHRSAAVTRCAAPGPAGVWLAVVAGGIILVLLIIFIAQNTEPATIQFLGWEGETPLAVALLIGTVAGLFLAALAGSLRILQLRRRVQRDNR